MSDEQKSPNEDRVFRILREEQRTLPVRMTDEEWTKRVHRLVRIGDEIESTDNEIDSVKSTVAGLKSKKEVLTVERQQVSRLVRDRAEDRQVKVIVEVEERTKTVYERRADTNEAIRERGLTQEEAQLVMFTDGPSSLNLKTEEEQMQERSDKVTQRLLSEGEFPKGEKPKKGKKKGKKAKDSEVDIGDLDKPDEGEPEEEPEEDPDA